MLHFGCDYLEGAHPAIMERLLETNLEQTSGYGFDHYSEEARVKIRTACAQPEAEVFFFVGGTKANATIIDAMLRSWQSVIAADTGHIAVHEAGAIEAAGHKIEALPSAEGKIAAATVESFMDTYLNDPTHAHMPEPAVVYVSYPSEFGTLYSKAELEALRATCDHYGLALFIDGARLGYGLASAAADVTLEDIACLADAFTIGGTKVGALFGEAAVLTNAKYADHFFTLMKQHGAVLAKGRLLGLQFDTLFTGDLYFKAARHALAMAERIKHACIEKGYSFYIDSPTNQQFVLIPQDQLQELVSHVSFDDCGPFDEEKQIVRFATSWATREEDVTALIDYL